MVSDWQEVAGRAQKGLPRPGRSAGCVSFRFLQQICERDLSQDMAVGHDRKGQLVLLHVDGQTEQRGVSPALRASTHHQRCPSDPQMFPGDLHAHPSPIFPRAGVPRSVPLPPNSSTFHTFALSFLGLGPHLLSSDWGEEIIAKCLLTKPEVDLGPILALPCAGSVAWTVTWPL